MSERISRSEYFEQLSDQDWYLPSADRSIVDHERENGNGNCYTRTVYLRGEHPGSGQIIQGRTGTETVMTLTEVQPVAVVVVEPAVTIKPVVYTRWQDIKRKFLGFVGKR